MIIFRIRRNLELELYLEFAYRKCSVICAASLNAVETLNFQIFFLNMHMRSETGFGCNILNPKQNIKPGNAAFSLRPPETNAEKKYSKFQLH